ESGVVVSQHHYLPFGEERPVPASPDPTLNRRAFTGHERDPESGLDYMVARYYGSSFARFMSPDPSPPHIVDPQTFNQYIYAGNNPIRFVDPDGRDFYLKCKGKDSNTCQGGHAGSMVKGKNGKEHFEATV